MDKYRTNRALKLVLPLIVLFSSIPAALADIYGWLYAWQRIDFGSFYMRAAGFVDFFVYLLIFLGLAQFTFARLYEGRSGKAVAIGVGTALAIGAVVAESMFGFNLGSLAPIAVILIIILLGIVVFMLFKSMDIWTGAALSWTYMIMYFISKAMFPGFWAWMYSTQYGRGLDGLLGIALLLAIWRGIQSVWIGFRVEDPDKSPPDPYRDPEPFPADDTPRQPRQKKYLPRPPMNLKAMPNPETGQIEVSWQPTPSSDNVNLYEVYRMPGRSKQKKFEQVGYAEPPSTRYVDEIVQPGEKYTYYIRAVNEFGRSNPSNYDHATVPDRPGPSPPHKPTIEPDVANNRLLVSWKPSDKAGEEHVVGYEVFRFPNSKHKEEYAQVPKEKDVLKGNEYHDSNVKRGITYSYRVRAVDKEDRRGGFSDHEEGTLPGVPDLTPKLHIKHGENEVVLSGKLE